MPNNKNDIPWKRLTAEAVAIVLSIMFAFWIDAWWAEKLERNLEREELSRLADEMTSNRDRIRSSIAETGTIELSRAASLRVYTVMTEALESEASTVAVADTLLARIIQTPSFESETPVYDGLVQSGRIEILENRNVLTAMARWDRFIRNAVEQQLRARRFVDDQLIPVLVSSGQIGNVLLNQYKPVRVNALSASGKSQLDTSRELTSLMAQRHFHIAMSSKMLGQAQEAADETLSAISEALDERGVD
jgi:hypothetical protein